MSESTCHCSSVSFASMATNRRRKLSGVSVITLSARAFNSSAGDFRLFNIRFTDTYFHNHNTAFLKVDIINIIDAKVCHPAF